VAGSGVEVGAADAARLASADVSGDAGAPALQAARTRDRNR
jgi:hypothetical protein